PPPPFPRLPFPFPLPPLAVPTSTRAPYPSSLRLLFHLERNANWVPAQDVPITATTTSQYLSSVILNNLPVPPFNIRMVRETADITTDQLQNRTLWSSYTEIIDV
ncbi:TipJ family phage tail tip protein, partial [Escherichia coli]|uniref:TipJ family phage tail tip protein n=1 Tax=Escherichia coli TaxID=562 RepID=UPI0035B61EFD